MDIVESCLEIIEKHLESLEDGSGSVAIRETSDTNLERILEQQTFIKLVIEKDAKIKALRRSLSENNAAIRNLRKICNDITLKGVKDRQELLDVQSKEIERFQIAQLQSINNDFLRHKQILEQRKKEVVGLKIETDKEESGREAYLADVSKSLERQLQARREQLRPDVGAFEDIVRRNNNNTASGYISRSVVDPKQVSASELDLVSVDELQLYQSAKGGRGRGRARGRGRGGGVRTQTDTDGPTGSSTRGKRRKAN